MKIRLTTALAVLLLALLASWSIHRTSSQIPSRLVLRHEPRAMMGTVSSLVLVTDRDHVDAAQKELQSAEAELRRLESLMSTWIETSQLSLFNSAPAGKQTTLADPIMEVLTRARQVYAASEGSFDITARPLIELWRRAGLEDSLPTQEDLREARAQSNWDQIQFGPGGVTKSLSSTQVDVDGIAKGYAIDKALELLQRSGARGGMVEVGGDLRLFGEGPEGGLWTLAIRSPFEDRPWAELEIQGGAVCSSGDYARYLEIGGRRFSHIVDPRTGRPTEATHAVTVVGQDAATADAWATALSILGVPGLPLLDQQEGLQAMVVTGGPDDYTVHATPGFRQILRRAAFSLSE